MHFFRLNIALLFTIAIVVIPELSNAQDNNHESKKNDTIRTHVTYNQTDSSEFVKDSIVVKHEDIGALDIGSNRGIFILSADRLLQLRIIGSVRARFSYGDQLMPNMQSLNPYEVPTGIDSRSPNYYAGIKQTRLGFEVTRHTETKGDIFIRIEADFNNASSNFRVRHAYGQIGWLLVGQTWSLMNNVSYEPAMVSKNGSPGANRMRNPQFRYSSQINKGMRWDVAIEYSAPNVNTPDSIQGVYLQVIPDITGRYTYSKDKFSLRVAGVLTTISGRVDSDDLNYSLGFGGSFSAWLKVREKNRFYLSVTSGKAISRFMDLFRGKNEDMAYDFDSKTFEALVSTGGYIAYSRSLPKGFSASISTGLAAITNRDFQDDDAYSYSYNALINVFWEPIDGARVGAEYAYGQRIDKGGKRGAANRVSILLYYDF